MRTSKSLGIAFLLINAVIAEAGVDLHQKNVDREVIGRKIENLISGVDRSANGVTELDLSAAENVQRSADDVALESKLVNRIAQLDVGALLNAGAQGPGQQQGQGQPPALKPAGPSDINTSNVGADLANQIAANGTLGLAPAAGPPQAAAPAPAIQAAQPAAPAAAASASGQGLGPKGPSDINTSNIAGDLANQLAPVPGAVSGVSGQPPANNDIGAALANQIAGVGAVAGQSPSAQGEVAAAQSGGAAGLAVVEIRSTIIQEVNGQQIATAVIIGQGQQAAAAAPAATGAPPAAAPPAPAPPAEAPPAGAPPAEAPAAMPIPSETLKSSAAASEPKSEAQTTQPPLAGGGGNATAPALGTITEVVAGGNSTAAAVEAVKSTASAALGTITEVVQGGNSTSTAVLSAPSGANAAAAPAAITVSAGGAPAPGVEAAAKSSSAAPPPVDSAKLTADALVASPTVTAAGNAVTVLAGSGGGSNGTASSTAKSGAAAAAITVVAGAAGSGSGGNSTSKAAGGGQAAAAVTVVAGQGSGNGTANAAASTTAAANAAVTVVAGAGGANAATEL